MKRYLFILVLAQMAAAQTATENYVLTRTYFEPVSYFPDPSKANTSITYFDGLGRPVQKIDQKMGGSEKNIVTPFVYDEFGRQPLEYLPYESAGNTLAFIADPVSEALSFYSGFREGTANPYSQTVFEASPLNRPLEVAAPGDSWELTSGHTVKTLYQTNEQDEVLFFQITTVLDSNGFYQPTLQQSGFFKPGELYKTIVRDENWSSGSDPDHSVEEFKDQQGRIILKRTFAGGIAHDTHYVYDEFGNLSVVIPPLATASNLSANQLNGLCYQYVYDRRNRMVKKKLPGRDAWEYIVYDRLDRPVLTGPVLEPTGDGSLGWLVTKYDVFGRIAYTAFENKQADESQWVVRQAYYDTPATPLYETRKSNTPSLGYTDEIEPTDVYLLTVSFYDDYDFPGAPTNFSSFPDVHYNASVKPIGLPTGNWVRVLEANTDLWEKSHSLYDEKSRMVIQHKDNFLGGFQTVETSFDFQGKPLLVKTTHKKEPNINAITTEEAFTYDSSQRQILYEHHTDSNIGFKLDSFYDELATLEKEKVFESTPGYLQDVDYRYNVRGWLKAINNVDSTATSQKLFAFKINYDTTEGAYLGGNPLNGLVVQLYNGNISETYWKTATDDVQRKYGYRYDALNRLLNSYYQKPAQGYLSFYDESLEYDKNGNIAQLNRNGDNDNTSNPVIEIDDLKYIYENDSNRLLEVRDLTNDPSGFADDGVDNPDYEYDDFGNLKADQNKSIDKIHYNHLNLPVNISIVKGGEAWGISYLYDATGRKLEKTFTEFWQATSPTETTLYLDGFQYRDDILQFFPHPEGYVRATLLPSDDYAFSYIYQYKDHLGNIRLNYGYDPVDEQVEILNEDHYYPFGLKHRNYSSGKKDFKMESAQLQISPTPFGDENPYLYKYQGQEWQDELGLGWYSFKWRNYDPAIGRFMSIDPLTESYEDYTPYQFASNQPVHAQEIEGLENAHDLNKRIQTRETREAVRDNIPQTDKRIVSTVRSVAAEGAYTGIKSATVRKEYKETVSKLDVKDSKGRTEAKLKARENTPAVVKAMIESERPNSVEMAKTAGTANKTNAGANATAEAFGAAGKGFMVVGVAASTYNIANAENKVEATAIEGGAWAGAIYGGETLGTAAAPLGPWGALGGAIVGSIVGGLLGEGTVNAIINAPPIKTPIDGVTGLPVPICFTAGTKITMANLAVKNIEDIKAGEFIQTFNIQTNTIEPKEVLLSEISKSDSFVEIEFEDGTLNTNTLSHPYYVLNKGWCSFDSKEAFKKHNVKVEDLKVGDYVYKLTKDGEIKNIKIVKIIIVRTPQKTYNLSNVKDNHNFFANGILVHNRS